MNTVKISFNWRWVSALAMVAAVIALAIVTAPTAAPPALARYVGPPLPDGSRVTFLHPASVSKFLGSPGQKPIRPWVVQDVLLRTPNVMTRGESIWYRLPIADRCPARDLAVGVKVTNISKTYLLKKIFVSGITKKQYIDYKDPTYGNVYADEVDIVDAPHGRQYSFRYYSLNNSQSPDFIAHKAAITNSFQVLPPGAAVPIP